MLMISHLEYVDDTLLITDPTLENLWIIREILIDFEGALELRVNFFKCSLIEVNADLA